MIMYDYEMAMERVEKFLDARQRSGNLDPEIITGMNGNLLYTHDLRLLMEMAAMYEGLCQ